MDNLKEAQATLKDLQADLRSLEASLQRAEEALTRARRERQEVDKLTQLATRRDTLAGLVRDQRRIVEEAEAELAALERQHADEQTERERERRLAKHPKLIESYRETVADLLATIRAELAKVLAARAAADDNARRLRELGRTVTVPKLTAVLEHPVSGETPLLAELEDFAESRGFTIDEAERQRQADEREASRQLSQRRSEELQAAKRALAQGDAAPMADYMQRWAKGETPVPRDEGPVSRHYRRLGR